LNVRDNRIDIFQYIAIGKAQYAVTKFSKGTIPFAVIRLAANVNTAVTFNDQFFFTSAKIDNKRGFGIFPDEFAALDLPIPQDLPKVLLSRRRVMLHFTCAVCDFQRFLGG
jgi:hypothetical protein